VARSSSCANSDVFKAEGMKTGALALKLLEDPTETGVGEGDASLEDAGVGLVGEREGRDCGFEGARCLLKVLGAF
jgi:hypothetical protein